jgi:hypothetical protein
MSSILSHWPITGHAGDSSEEEEQAGSLVATRRPPQHRRRVGGEGYRLVIPEHLTAIPQTVLDPGRGPLPFPGMPPPGAGDAMAVVPYIPSQVRARQLGCSVRAQAG